MCLGTPRHWFLASGHDGIEDGHQAIASKLALLKAKVLLGSPEPVTNLSLSHEPLAPPAAVLTSPVVATSTQKTFH